MSNKMKLLIIPGMPRAGTTFLHLYLKKHPSICAAPIKEINFFSTRFEKGFSWYEELFEDQGSRWALDVSPVYFFDDKALARLEESSQYDMRFVIGIRKPSEWIVSFYKQVQRHFLRPPEFSDFVGGHEWDVEGTVFNLDFSPGFVKKRVESIKESISAPVMFFDFDLLEKDPLRLLNEIERFMGEEQWFNESNFENSIVNSSDRKSNRLLTYLMNQKVVKSLAEGLIPDRIKASMRDQMASKSATRSKEVDEPAQRMLDQLPQNQLDLDYIDAMFSGNGIQYVN